mgnify:CR=1 FL=1
MSTIVGEVSKLEGIVRAINPVTGEVRVLEKGSPVFAGEIIQTSGKGGVVVDMTNGTLLTLGRDTQMRLDDDVSGKASTVDSGTEGAVDIAALQQAVLEGNFDELEATAAGVEDTTLPTETTETTETTVLPTTTSPTLTTGGISAS